MHKLTVLIFVCLGVTAQTRQSDIPLRNWPVPLYWQPAATETEAGLKPRVRQPQPEAASSPLVFVAMTPCRVVDTRASQMFPDPFGQPSLVPGIARTFRMQISTRCSIPTTAQAYSLNVTVVPPGPLGYLTIYPHGQPTPNAVTLDDLLGTIVNNAAIVPAGTVNGAVDVVANAVTDLVLDINGYYAPLNQSNYGHGSVAIGEQALPSNTGFGNIAIGDGTLLSDTSGFYNIAIGYEAGLLVTGNDNIEIGNVGTPGDVGITRIGTPSSQIAFFAAGIRGVTPNRNNGVPVYIDTDGQLGTAVSSRRFKEDIQDMADASSGLLRLHPVTYRYQKPYVDGSKPIDYGLIAEEVAEVYPDLVVKGADGQVETVQYQKLTPMLVNELQKEHERVRELREQISELRKDHAALQKALQLLMAEKSPAAQ